MLSNLPSTLPDHVAELGTSDPMLYEASLSPILDARVLPIPPVSRHDDDPGQQVAVCTVGFVGSILRDDHTLFGAVERTRPSGPDDGLLCIRAPDLASPLNGAVMESLELEIELTGGSPPPVASHTTPYSPLRQAGMGLSPPVVTPSSGSPRPQGGGRTQPGSPAAVAGSSTTVMAFIDSLKLPLQEPLIKTAPRPRQGRRIDDSVVPHRSDTGSRPNQSSATLSRRSRPSAS